MAILFLFTALKGQTALCSSALWLSSSWIHAAAQWRASWDCWRESGYRQDTRSSSDALIQLTPMLVSSRSLRCSCCCWTACGSFGDSSPWLWASLRRCSCDWRLKFMPRIMAPFCEEDSVPDQTADSTVFQSGEECECVEKARRSSCSSSE